MRRPDADAKTRVVRGITKYYRRKTVYNPFDASKILYVKEYEWDSADGEWLPTRELRLIHGEKKDD